MSVLIITCANKNIIHALRILYWLNLTVARRLHDCKLSANRFANFGTGLIFPLLSNTFILQRMIARIDVTRCERSNQLTSVVWRHIWQTQRCLGFRLKNFKCTVHRQNSFLSGPRNLYVISTNCTIRLKLSSSSLVVRGYDLSSNIFDRSLPIKITLNFCRLITSSILGEVFEKAAVWIFSLTCSY